tara:strand:- start:23 stop:388 length:366 start_codon:yes stop_codon:yes gene_type:complete
LSFWVSLGYGDDGRQLEQFLASNDFEYLVELDVEDFAYEVNAKYSFVLQILGVKEDHALSDSFKKRIGQSVEVVERAHEVWVEEIKRLTEISNENPQFQIFKFVLFEDSDEHPVVITRPLK